ncbi:MAG TPA: hydrogenase expression/formation protein HypE [Verrucomicrobiae bacterium]|nr:hydrogenase expression/formation protein HypE [Verrucomicrobiae bacterium]
MSRKEPASTQPDGIQLDSFTCPAPLPAGGQILLGHGSGGKLSADLVRDVFLAAFDNPTLARLDDQAIVTVPGTRLAFTTDTFVVKPLFFPGGDIGSLAVHGTVNDLAMGGAQPLFLSAAFLIEEGFSMEMLRAVVASLQRAAASAGVQVVTGDTKVVEKGSGDGLFINTSGIGVVPENIRMSADQARPGDCVLLSGFIGDHGIAILAKREGLEFESELISDSAALHTLVADMLAAGGQIRCLRDPTRGGVSSTLNEIASRSRVGIEIDERAIPIREEVRGACEMLGLDPLYVANEGKLVAVVAPETADCVLQAMRRHPLGAEARMIGRLTGRHPGLVTMRTTVGPSRIVDMLPGDQLPRIC